MTPINRLDAAIRLSCFQVRPLTDGRVVICDRFMQGKWQQSQCQMRCCKRSLWANVSRRIKRGAMWRAGIRRQRVTAGEIIKWLFSAGIGGSEAA